MKHRYSLLPKIVSVFKDGYSVGTFLKDLNAGIIVGVVAIPLAIAFAIASGVKPEQGLYTAIIAGLIISVLGGSRYQIGGPTGAFIVIVYGIVGKYGYDGLATATLIAGFILLTMAFLRVGAYIKFIPYPVTIGFTSGIALIIFTGQIKDFFGLEMDSLPAGFVGKIQAYAQHIGDMNPWAAGIALFSLALLIIWPKFIRKIPASLVAIILCTAAVKIFNIPVETIESRFGQVPNTLPAPHFPNITFELARKMFSPAVTIAVLAAVESLLSAVVADGMTGRRHRSNAEIMAQGFANIGSVMFGGIPATGAIARTATNIKNGGQTPVAGIIHAVTILLIMLFFGKWAGMIPIAVLAAILVFVAYQMSEWRTFAGVFKYPKSDVAVMLITFFLTVIVDLTAAIEVGILLAMFLLVNRVTEVTHAGFVDRSLDEEENKEDKEYINSIKKIPDGVEVFEIDGVFFFGVIDKFKDSVTQELKNSKVFILYMEKVISIDGAGIKALDEVFNRLKSNGTQLLLCGVHQQPSHALEKAGLSEKIGKGNILGNIEMAYNRARKIMETK